MATDKEHNQLERNRKQSHAHYKWVQSVIAKITPHGWDS